MIYLNVAKANTAKVAHHFADAQLGSVEMWRPVRVRPPWRHVGDDDFAGERAVRYFGEWCIAAADLDAGW